MVSIQAGLEGIKTEESGQVNTGVYELDSRSECPVQRFGTTIAPWSKGKCFDNDENDSNRSVQRTIFGKGKVHHVELGANFFGDRFDRCGTWL